MEVHHKDPTQKLSHNVWSWSEERRLAELSKCVVLCEECHKKESSRYSFDKVDHGTLTKYRNHGCRCQECRAAQNHYQGWYNFLKNDVSGKPIDYDRLKEI